MLNLKNPDIESTELETPGPDDYGMMRELLTRRYEKLLRENEDHPDLILVDGGKGQLKIAVEVLKSLNLNYDSSYWTCKGI